MTNNHWHEQGSGVKFYYTTSVFMDYLQNGVPVKYYDKGEERSTLVYLVDFKNPASNDVV